MQAIPGVTTKLEGAGYTIAGGKIVKRDGGGFGQPPAQSYAPHQAVVAAPKSAAAPKAAVKPAAALKEVKATVGAGSLPAASSSPSQPPPLSKGPSTKQNEKKILTAAKNGDTQEVLNLLKKGTDPNARTESDQSPLHFAVSSNNNELAKILIAHHADVNAGMNKNTPLHTALFNDRFEIAKLLIAHHADVNAREDYKRTPLAAPRCIEKQRRNSQAPDRVSRGLECARRLQEDAAAHHRIEQQHRNRQAPHRASCGRECARLSRSHTTD